MAPPAAMLRSAVWAYVREWFDSVPHSCRLDAHFAPFPHHLVPVNYKDDCRCGDLPHQSPFPGVVRACQPSHLDWDHPSFVLRMNLVPHLMQALCAFAHLPREWYCMDCQPVSGFIFFNVDDSLVDCTCCVDDNVRARQCHRCHRILAGHCRDSTLRGLLRVHYPDVGRCLLVEKRSADR